MTKHSNEEWLSYLRSNGTEKEEALTDLRKIILAGLSYALEKWIRHDDPRFSAFLEEVAQETLVRVLKRLDSFEGRSQFTTWVHTIAVHVALSELRRVRWLEVSLDEMLEVKDSDDEPRDLVDPGTGVEEKAEQKRMVAVINKMIQNELTEKQRQALISVAVNGLSIDETAILMKVERNALYKIIHDARVKLKKRLELERLSPAEILASFETK